MNFNIIVKTIVIYGFSVVLMTAAYAQAANNGVGYSSPAEALRALAARPGVQFSMQNGWIIANDRNAHTLWSFAPSTDPSHPAVVKRQVVQIGDKIGIQMSILCGGTQAACDHLEQEFQALNDQAKQFVRSPP